MYRKISHSLLFFTLGLLLCLVSELSAQSEFTIKHDSINWVDSKGLKQGKFRKNDRNGKPVYEGYFRNDKPYGIFRYFDEDGKTMAITVFSKDAKSCHTTMFDRNGSVMAKGKYINQLRDSIWVFYNSDTVLVARETYLVGKKNGVCYNYFAGGKIAEESHWKNGVQEGHWKEYTASGTVKGEGDYINGCPEGKVTYYFDTGEKRVDCYYKGCLAHGQWMFYKAGSGEVDHIVIYKEGRVIGGTGIDVNEEMKKGLEEFKEKNEQEHLGGPPKDDGNDGN